MLVLKVAWFSLSSWRCNGHHFGMESFFFISSNFANLLNIHKLTRDYGLPGRKNIESSPKFRSHSQYFRECIFSLEKVITTFFSWLPYVSSAWDLNHSIKDEHIFAWSNAYNSASMLRIPYNISSLLSSESKLQKTPLFYIHV